MEGLPDSVLPLLHGASKGRCEATALLWLVRRSGVSDWHVERWSFAQVWSAASAGATRLRGLGVGEQGRCGPSRVGVAVAEGPALALLELAIFLAGGAIVPLDACDVIPRLASAIEDAELSLAVTKDDHDKDVIDAAAAAAFPTNLESRPRVVMAAEVLSEAVISTGAAPTVSNDIIPVEVGGTPSSTSHVFFTSGSTGRPKGCIVTHRALASYCLARNAIHGVDQDAVCLVASAHTFDPSLGDLMATWAAGGCVVFAPRAELFTSLGALLSVSEATHICCTPSLFATLAGTRYASPEALPRLRVVALGGEPTPPSIVSVWSGQDNLRLLNTYGVTECCVYNTVREVDGSEPGGLIGAALPRNRLAIVLGSDEDAASDRDSLELASHGDVGELLIAGVQVGEGYARRPELTQQRFVLHPELGRAYLTGDLACEGPQGLALLGRKDNQVKIRGHRIELAEVEHWLLAAAGPLLSMAAATCLEGKLVAFCSPASALSSSRAERALRATLRWLCDSAVPSAMRPQRYVFASALPLTASGKVARGLLAELLPSADGRHDRDVGDGSADGDDEGDPGQDLQLSALEAAVAEAWAPELAQPLGSLGRKSHFLELGGHSIAALRVCRRLAISIGGIRAQDAEEALGGDLGEVAGTFAPVELLRRPCLGDYASYLSQQGISVSGVSNTCKEEAGNEQAMPQVDADTVSDAISLEDTASVLSRDATVKHPKRFDDDPQSTAVDLLHQAAAAGAVPIITFLVGQGHSHVDGKCLSKRLKGAARQMRSQNHSDKTSASLGEEGMRPPAPLHSAAANGSVEAIAALLNLRASVTATEAHGLMALHLAASRGPPEAVDKLLEFGAPLAAKDLNQQTALHFAARSGNVDTLELLLSRWLGNADLVAQGIRMYAGPLDWRDRWHRTPVHWASLNDHATVLELLLEARAAAEPPQVRSSRHSKSTTLRHESPLQIAQRRGLHAITVLLLRYGAADEAAANSQHADKDAEQ